MTNQNQKSISFKKIFNYFCICAVAICSAITFFALLKFLLLGETYYLQKSTDFQVYTKLMPLSLFLFFTISQEVICEKYWVCENAFKMAACRQRSFPRS